MDTLIVIPARYASKRLPGKPLLRTTGKYLIQHVYERACQARCAKAVIVATDDPRIEAAVLAFGGRVMMTRRDHASGTDRVAEVARVIESDIVVNLQGDEPLIDPTDLDRLIDLLAKNPTADMATFATPFRSEEAWRDANAVKVVCDNHGRALYFSRSPIPYVRDGEPMFNSEPPRFFLHLGLYAYRRAFLFELSETPPCALEQLEKLEQLRVLAMGRSIHVGITHNPACGVDTMDDYRRFVEAYRACGSRRAA